jgi:coenzyme Q-binding protein COQ10
MPKMRETILSNSSTNELFSLVLDIEKYPDFLPWCSAAKIVSQENNILIADLVISFKGYTETFRSKVTFIENEKIKVNFIKGPFTHLFNLWQFEEIDDAPHKSKLTFEIDFAFKSRILETIVGLFFKQAADKLIIAFIKRAHEQKQSK